MNKLLKGFIVITFALFTLGFAMNISSGESDIFQLWLMSTFLSGWYLWEHRYEN